jgi:hypothetical protein
MANQTPAMVTQTKLDNDATKDVYVVPKRTVTYLFLVTSAENLNIPFAVAVGGVVSETFKSKPRRVSGDSGRIVVNDVTPGTQVALFLNSDAHPAYRKNPVYVVTPGSRNVIVKIVEKSGKHSETDTPVQIKHQNAEVEAEKKEDTYAAVLTGDIWMKISHKYSSTEIDALLPSNTCSSVVTAVKRIYDGLLQPKLEIVVPSSEPGGATNTIFITFQDGDNPRENISLGYEFLTEGLSRVHPAGYAAVFSAAIDAGVNKVTMTSAWRPMLGSIAHRAGLGLDVNYVGTTRINREELRKANAVDTTNVSQEEKNLLAEFESSKALQTAARKEVGAANATVSKAKGDSVKTIIAKQKLKEAIEASEAADKACRDAEIAWNAERDKNEPDEVRRFRASLLKCKNVAQLFDPWYMDSDNLDQVAPAPNMQRNANEKLHAHHLHLTVHEPRIL